MMLQSKYDIGQEVYLKTDADQKKRMVTGILIRGNNVQYDLACGSSSSWHFEFEVSPEKDMVTAVTNTSE